MKTSSKLKKINKLKAILLENALETHLYKNRAAIEIPLQIRPVSDTVIEANYKKNKFPKGDYWFLEDAMNHLCKFGLLNHWKPKKGFFEVVVVCDFGEIQEAKIIHLKNKAA